MKYDFTSEQINAEIIHIQASVFKLLPYFDNQYKDLDGYFESVLQMLNGINIILEHPPKIMSVIALVELARTEKDKGRFRKLVLDSCGILNSFKESDAHD